MRIKYNRKSQLASNYFNWTNDNITEDYICRIETAKGHLTEWTMAQVSFDHSSLRPKACLLFPVHEMYQLWSKGLLSLKGFGWQANQFNITLVVAV